MAPKAKSTDKKSKPKTIAERVLNRKRAPKEILRYNDKDFKHAGIATVGDGKRLADIEMIRKSITHLRKNGDTLALIHRAIYQTRGSNETRKEDILNFSGLKAVNEDGTESLIEKRTEYLANMKPKELVTICKCFCLAGAMKEKKPEEYAKEIIEFLKKPGNKKPVKISADKVVDKKEKSIENSASDEAPKKKKSTVRKSELKKEKSPKKVSEGKKSKKNSPAPSPKKSKKASPAPSPKKVKKTSPAPSPKKSKKNSPAPSPKKAKKD